MKKTYLSLIIVVIFLLIIPFITDLQYHTCKKKLINKNDIYYRTGDLLFFRWVGNNLVIKDNVSDKLKIKKANMLSLNRYTLFSSIISGYYTHIGMIIVINNIPYIYEITQHNSYKNRPKFDQWTRKVVSNKPTLLNISFMESYGGHVYYIPYIGDTININKIINALNKYANFRLDILNSTIQCLSYDKLSINSNHYLSCTSFISNVLNDLGIVNSKHKNCSTPMSILKDCYKSGKYSDVVKLINTTYEKKY